MNKKSMQEILRETPRFSSRAAYFSGRGAITCDLNYDILTHIHNAIRQEYGGSAAKEMVNMVASMNNCNATDFINNCYRLEANNFKWEVAKSIKNGIEIEKNEDGTHNEFSAMASIMEMMFGDSNRNQTPQIRNRFLIDNGIKISEQMDIHGNIWHY